MIFWLAPHCAFGCTSFAFQHNGYFIFGANYDNNLVPGMIFVNKRNIKKTGWEPGKSDKIAVWVSEYGSITFTCVGYQLAWAGMNEKGLTISTLALNETRNPAPDRRPPLVSPLWMQYLLDTCATVDEVIQSDRDIRISDTVDHYLVCDRKGNCAAIEFLDGKMVCHTAEDLPVRIPTNDLYSDCVKHWRQDSPSEKNYHDSKSRFAQVARLIAATNGQNKQNLIEYAFNILGEVSHPNHEYTRWSIVFVTENYRIYYRSYTNPNIRRIDLKTFDFNCATPIKMLNVHNDLSGNITQCFKDYSHDASLDFLLSAVQNHRPDFPKEKVPPLLQMMEGYLCQCDQ